MPSQWYASRIIATLGSLPKLLELNLSWERLAGNDREIARIAEMMDAPHFPSLQSLGWSSSICLAADFLQHTPRQLRKVTLDCTSWSNNDELSGFLGVVVNCCPALNGICLNLEYNDEVDPLNWDVVRALFPCTGLTELRMHYGNPCIISDSDVQEMAAAWPNMRELLLCPDPNAHEGTRGPPISTLAQFAASFPYIRVLGLYCDCIQPPGFAGDLLSKQQFTCLRNLNVGTSYVPRNDPASVGLYLASLCAVYTQLEITANQSQVRDYTVDPELDADSFPEQWEKVERIVHAAPETKRAFLRRLNGHVE